MPASSSRATLIRSAPGPVRPKQLAPSAPGPGRHGPPVAPVRQRAPQPVDVDLIGAVRAERVNRGWFGGRFHPGRPGGLVLRAGGRAGRGRGENRRSLVTLVGETRLPDRGHQVPDQGVQIPLVGSNHHCSDARPVLRGIQLVSGQCLIQDATAPEQVLRCQGV